MALPLRGELGPSSKAQGGGKLSLRRKRPLALEEGGEPPEQGPRTCASIPSHFQKPGSSDAEGVWMTLLRALEPNLDPSSLEEAVTLPVFLPKSSQSADPEAKPEAFTTGTKEFQWFPFPRYQRQGTKGNNLRRHQKSENGTAGLIKREQYEDERPKAVSPVPEQNSSTASEQTSEVSKMNFGIKYSTQLDCGERFESCQHAPNSPGHSSLTSAQSRVKGFEKRWERCSLPGGMESRRGNGKGNPSNNDTLVQGCSSLNESTSTLPSQDPCSASFGGQGKTEHPSEDIPTLEKCPMCQVHFPGTWSGLDVDSHLSKCLSESADDITW